MTDILARRGPSASLRRCLLVWDRHCAGGTPHARTWRASAVIGVGPLPDHVVATRRSPVVQELDSSSPCPTRGRRWDRTAARTRSGGNRTRCKVGKAACREKVCQDGEYTVVGVALKKQNRKKQKRQEK